MPPIRIPPIFAIHPTPHHILLLLLLLPLLPQPAYPFAAWMITPPSRCWTTLEPGSIVMNHEILPVEQSRESSIHLVATKIMTTTADNSNDNNDENDNAILFQPHDQFVIRLESPPSLYDLQFIMQLETNTTKSDDNDGSDDGGAQFIHGRRRGGPIGCDGTRVSGRRTDEVVLYFPAASDVVHTTMVWAGWATDHQAVTLTHPLIFRQMMTDEGGEENEKKTQEEELAETFDDSVANDGPSASGEEL